MVNRCKTTVRTPTWLSGRQGVKFKITGVGTGGRIVDLSLEIRENIRATVDWGIYPKMLFCSITVSAIVPAALCSKKAFTCEHKMLLSPTWWRSRCLLVRLKWPQTASSKSKAALMGKWRKMYCVMWWMQFHFWHAKWYLEDCSYWFLDVSLARCL